MSTYIYFTEAQKEQAKSTDLVSFLQSRGEMLKRSGSEYEWRDGNAKVTIRGNKWFHHYDNEGGTAVDFICRFFNADFQEAMQILLGEQSDVAPSYHRKYISTVKKKPFTLPKANGDMRRVYAYLLRQRFLDREVIHYFTHNKMLYEDEKHHNCIFVGYDENGIARHAHKRGTYGANGFKGNVESSDADYGFHHIGISNRLYVFEAPIDMLSFINLNKENWQKHSYVALCCVGDRALRYQLKANPHISHVLLCLDNDKAGQEANTRIAKTLDDYQVSFLISDNKDWNEDLMALKMQEINDQSFLMMQ